MLQHDSLVINRDALKSSLKTRELILGEKKAIIKVLQPSQTRLESITLQAPRLHLLYPRCARWAQTYTFTVWMLDHVFLAFISRSEKLSVAELGIFTNKVKIVWGVIAVIFLLIITGMPMLSDQLKLTTMKASDLALIFIISFVAIIWQEAVKFARLRYT